MSSTAFASLPFRPPLAPMLAKLEDDLPRGEGWLYEPKWDGFRAIVYREGPNLEIGSRDKRSLLRYFPELTPPLLEALPERCVLDGEIVLAGPRGLDFDALLMRIHPAESRVRRLAAETPASYVAFDLLALDVEDLRSSPFERRRSSLESALHGIAAVSPRFLSGQEGMPTPPAVSLTPQTASLEEARDWFDAFEAAGLEGIVAKRREQVYQPGDRAMVKVKHRRSVDCVVGGYRSAADGSRLGSLLLGLYDDRGALSYVGHTSSFSQAEGERVLALLRPLQGGRSFGDGRSPGGPSRWSAGRDSDWVPIRPELVCEVSFDYLQGNRFRHAARFLRWRPDKPPAECRFDQIQRHR